MGSLLRQWLETNAYLSVRTIEERAKPTGANSSDDAVLIRLSKRRTALIFAPAAVGALRKMAYKRQSCARPQQWTVVARRTEEIRPCRGR
jgi:hypothetical protein